jgi:hypothetical protein
MHKRRLNTSSSRRQILLTLLLLLLLLPLLLARRCCRLCRCCLLPGSRSSRCNCRRCRRNCRLNTAARCNSSSFAQGLQLFHNLVECWPLAVVLVPASQHQAHIALHCCPQLAHSWKLGKLCGV